MDWAITRNRKPLALADVPDYDPARLFESVVRRCQADGRIVLLFGTRLAGGATRVYAVVAQDGLSRLLVSSTTFEPGRPAFQSQAARLPALALFERELAEEFGLHPEGHPWPKPVRYPHGAAARSEDYPFYTMAGDAVHEVGVGPVHAGVIEPGHFRFQCHGEEIHHLEIQLGYQHRGVETLLAADPRRIPHLAESIAGDSVVAHASAAAGALEGLGGTEAPRRAEAVRALALELERAAMHVGDLGALAGDVAWLPGQAFFGATRTLLINASLALCGSRFGRGLVRPGGVTADVDRALAAALDKTVAGVAADVDRLCATMFDAPDVLARFERVGIVPHDTALALGLLGPAARASGVAVDARVDQPWGSYRTTPVHKQTLDSGDVFARAYLRWLETQHSLRLVRELLADLPAGPCRAAVGPPAPAQLVVSLVEGWRGEIAHAVVTGTDGAVVRYKVKDPSFHNWAGLAYAVRGNGISDFPVCNKSFNLSYCGFDL